MEYQWNPCLQTLEGHAKEVKSVCFSHDSRLLASASTDCTVKIWDSSNGECLTTLEHSAKVVIVSFSDDSGLLASASVDSTIRLWDTSNWQRIMTMENDGGRIASLTFFYHRESQDKKDRNSIFLAAGSSDGTLNFWNMQNGKCFETVKGHSDWNSQITISHDFQLLALASLDSTIKIWDVQSGRCIYILKGHKKAVYSVAFSHGSEYLVSSSLDGNIKLWKTGTWECLQTFGGSTTSTLFYSLKFSHDSRHLASGSSDHAVRLWDTSSGQCIRSFSGHRDSVFSIAFSHDSQRLASASSDRTIRIWETSSSQHLNNFETHCDASPIFSDDSRRLASVSENDTYYIKVWDAGNGQCLQKIKAWDSRLVALIFSFDLEFIATLSTDEIVRVWNVSNGECIQTTRAINGISQCFLDNLDLRLFDGTVRSSSVCRHGLNERSFLTLPHVPESGIGIRGECITWNSECLLWLPPDYRPAGSSSTIISGSSVCICCASGRVLIFTFDSAMLSHILADPDTDKVRA